MKLSIIIPVYRSEATLERCIKSVLCQSFTDYELLLVDDGSDDRCAELCDQFTAQHTAIQVIHKAHEGLSETRNAGLDKAQGEYVTFIDSDDTIGKNTLEPLMYDLLQHPDIDLLEYPVYERYGHPQRQHRLTFQPETFSNPVQYWLQTNGYEHTYAWNKIYRRSLFDKVRFPKGMVFEDSYLLPRLIGLLPLSDKNNEFQHIKLRVTNLGTYFYHWNENGITNQATLEDIQQLWRNIQETAPYIESAAKEGNYKKALRRWRTRLLNVEITVREQTGTSLVRHALWQQVKQCQLTTRGTWKAMFIILFGIEKLCKIRNQFHKN